MADKPGIVLFQQHPVFSHPCLCERNIFLLFLYILAYIKYMTFFLTDKKALYLVNTAQNGAQIYDMVANSSAEKKT
jgi:hypothetical protein